MQSWASEELRDADLGDVRLNKRLVDIIAVFGSIEYSGSIVLTMNDFR